MSMFFHFLKYWLEGNKNKIFWAAVVILVFFLGFGLGYQAGREASRAPIIIEKGAEAN